MRRGPKLLARLVVFAALTRAVPDADASRPLITVGEVSARVQGADAATETMLRALVSREIGRLDVDHACGRDSYVFSASLVRLDARASRDGSQASCVVSGALRRARTGALLAVTRGSGMAEDARGALEGAKEQALEAAVHGAVKGLVSVEFRRRVER